MSHRQLKPRCSIKIIDIHGRIVPILDEGAVIEPPGPRRKRYREYWTEEEDLFFVHRQKQSTSDGAESFAEYTGQFHGNIGYELIIHPRTHDAVLNVNYFMVWPSLVDGSLLLRYEHKSVAVYRLA